MKELRVVYLGGKQAGLVGLLTVASFGCHIMAVVPRDRIVGDMAVRMSINCYDSVKDEGIKRILKSADLLVSVHSKEIVPINILWLPRLGGINVHPCLYKYKGKDPISRLLGDGETRASVGVHYMVEEVDCGEVIREIFVDIDTSKIKSVVEVYNELYPIYSRVIFEVLEILRWELTSIH